MATANYGMGSGTPRQELERWMKEAGKITAHEEGEQLTLDGGSVRMVRLWNKAGESILVTAETAAEYGFRPGAAHRARMERAPSLFDTQEAMF